MQGSKRHGFSLIMVCMLLTVAALLLVAMLSGGELGDEGDKAQITIERMEAIEEATRAYMASHEHRPCPANGSAGLGSTNLGVEPIQPCASSIYNFISGGPSANYVKIVALNGNYTTGSAAITGITFVQGTINDLAIGEFPMTSFSPGPDGYIASIDSSTQISMTSPATATGSHQMVFFITVAGGVPTRALALPDEYGFDGWGRRIMYAVDTRATEAYSCSALASTKLHGSIPVIKTVGTPTIDQTTWALISYGKDGNGAFPMQGGSIMNSGATDADELNNTPPIGNLVRKEPTATFDDIVWDRDATKNICCWGPKLFQIAPPLDGTYTTGQVLTFVLSYTQPVTVQGTPRLVLSALGGGTNNIGTLNVAYANYVSGSGAASITYAYTVQSTDKAPGGISLSASIDLNGGLMSPCARFLTPPDLSNVIIGHAQYLYVPDYTNNRIQKFDTNGNYITQWPSTYPIADAVDASGNVWVIDFHNGVGREYDSNGSFIMQFGAGYGSGNGQFEYPFGAVFDGSGNLWVLDLLLARLQEFNPSGSYVTQISFGGFGYPAAIAIDPGGNFWLSEIYNNNVSEFNGSGALIRQVGSSGSGNGQFSYPFGTAFDGAGNLWVADQENERVQEFTGTGSYIGQFGTAGTGDGQFNSPSGIAIDNAGNLWVTDFNNDRVEEFSSSGSYIRQFGSAGGGDGQFNSPYGIAISH